MALFALAHLFFLVLGGLVGVSSYFGWVVFLGLSWVLLVPFFFLLVPFIFLSFLLFFFFFLVVWGEMKDEAAKRYGE